MYMHTNKIHIHTHPKHDACVGRKPLCLSVSPQYFRVPTVTLGTKPSLRPPSLTLRLLTVELNTRLVFLLYNGEVEEAGEQFYDLVFNESWTALV